MNEIILYLYYVQQLRDGLVNWNQKFLTTLLLQLQNTQETTRLQIFLLHKTSRNNLNGNFLQRLETVSISRKKKCERQTEPNGLTNFRLLDKTLSKLC